MARAKTRLSPKATFVKYGYGQVEPNKLSARHNGQVYAQLPAKSTIDVLENGMFVKYDYANGEVNFTGPGDWLLVFNEVKVYEDRETDADFAMIKDNYSATVYNANAGGKYARYLNGETLVEYDESSTTKGVNTNGMMPENTTMVPRVLGTRIGDIMTTNTIKLAENATLKSGDTLVVDTDGYLKSGGSATSPTGMTWQVVKVYNMPDLQPGVKIIRIA